MLALHPGLNVVIGVDTDKDTHTAAAVGATGAVLEHLTVPADPACYRQLIGFGRRHGARLWAIEGTGSFGAGLTTALHGCCERVVEVDRPQRPARRGGVKSDDIDAVRAAGRRSPVWASASRAAAETGKPSGCCWPSAGRRSRSISALHAQVASGPDGLRQRLRPVPLGQLLQTCAGYATPRDEAWRRLPPCWLCAPPRVGRWPASGRPPNSRSSSTGWSDGSPPSCSTSWESALSWPVSSSPPGRTTDESVPRPPSPSSPVPHPSRRRRGRSLGTD
jgi:hypothetical protein